MIKISSSFTRSRGAVFVGFRIVSFFHAMPGGYCTNFSFGLLLWTLTISVFNPL